MATPTQGKPGVAPKPAASAASTATTGGKVSMSSSGAFSSEQLVPDSNAFPPLYEAAILYAALRDGAVLAETGPVAVMPKSTSPSGPSG